MVSLLPIWVDKVSLNYPNHYSPAVPSGFPQMFNGIIQSSSSVTFNWSAPLATEQNGLIVSYTINITETGSGLTIQRTVPNTQTIISISSLFPFTSYDCSIAASTFIGIGPFSTILTVNTPEDSKYNKQDHCSLSCLLL